jgi:hypothetical protein
MQSLPLDQSASIPGLCAFFGQANPWEPYLKNNRIWGLSV